MRRLKNEPQTAIKKVQLCGTMVCAEVCSYPARLGWHGFAGIGCIWRSAVGNCSGAAIDVASVL